MGTRIALVGRAKVGRSAISSYLQDKHGFKEMGLQDGVRRTLRTLYGWTTYHRVPWETSMKFYDALYKLDSNIWIGFLAWKIERTKMPNIVVDDVRYLNEVEVLKNLGFKIVRITSPNINSHHLSKNLMDAAPGNLLLQEWYNKDFTELIGVDYSIHNGSREAMKRAVDSLVINLTVQNENPDE